MEEDFRPVELYGGYMQSVIPPFFDDASDFRQIPDHQEVFVHQETGCCLIIELNARQPSVSNEEAAEFFFKDLAQASGAVDFRVEQKRPLGVEDLPFISNDPNGKKIYACCSSGKQVVAKFNEEGRENTIHVEQAILRVAPPISTEVLITLSAPVVIHPASSEARSVKRCLTAQEARLIHSSFVRALKVNDWALFVPEGEAERGDSAE